MSDSSQIVSSNVMKLRALLPGLWRIATEEQQELASKAETLLDEADKSLAIGRTEEAAVKHGEAWALVLPVLEESLERAKERFRRL